MSRLVQIDKVNGEYTVDTNYKPSTSGFLYRWYSSTSGYYFLFTKDEYPEADTDAYYASDYDVDLHTVTIDEVDNANHTIIIDDVAYEFQGEI